MLKGNDNITNVENIICYTFKNKEPLVKLFNEENINQNAKFTSKVLKVILKKLSIKTLIKPNIKAK